MNVTSQSDPHDLHVTDLIAHVIVTSDRCHQDIRLDSSGAYVSEELRKEGFKKVKRYVIKDHEPGIVALLKDVTDDSESGIVITVGGTGLCPRDVTPEATYAVIDRHCSGIQQALMNACLEATPFAAFSRQTVGIRKKTLIVNFPGKLDACKTCWKCFKGLIKHSIEQVRFCASCVDKTHKSLEQKRDSNGHHHSDLTCQDNPQHPGESIGANSSEIENKPSQQNDNVPVEQVPNATDDSRSESPEQACTTVSTTSIDTVPCAQETGDSLSTSHVNDDSAKRSYSDEDTVISKKRARVSQYPLFDYLEALNLLVSISNDHQEQTETVALSQYGSALSIIGKRLSETYTSRRTIPDCPVSTMDGYCVIIDGKDSEILSSESVDAHELKGHDAIIKRLKDSETPETGPQIYCYPVNTGGSVPSENSIVVPIEDTRATDVKSIITLKNLNCHTPGRWIRKPGNDLCHTDKIISGTCVGPVELSLLLSMGITEVKVSHQRIVSLISTGDEVVSPFEDITDGVIDANGPLLNALFANSGYSIYNGGIVADDPALLTKAMNMAMRSSDVLVISGGASMGSKDFVKQIFEDKFNGRFKFGRVNMKPGKPAAFGQCTIDGKTKYIFCLPGNPVSAYVTAIVLVRPFLQSTFERKLRSHGDYRIPAVPEYDIINNVFDTFIAKIADVPDDNDEGYEFDNRMEFLRAKVLGVEEKTSVRIVSVSIKQQSSRLLNLIGCDCLLIVPPDVKRCRLQKEQIFSAFYIPQ